MARQEGMHFSARLRFFFSEIKLPDLFVGIALQELLYPGGFRERGQGRDLSLKDVATLFIWQELTLTQVPLSPREGDQPGDNELITNRQGVISRVCFIAFVCLVTNLLGDKCQLAPIDLLGVFGFFCISVRFPR
jgi:hypothetical protein